MDMDEEVNVDLEPEDALRVLLGVEQREDDSENETTEDAPDSQDDKC